MPGKAQGVMMSDTSGMIDVLATNEGGTVGFYGVTPITRRTSASQAAVSTSAYGLLSATPASAGGTWGFATSTQAVQAIASIIELQNRSSANIVLLNELRAALVALGAITGS